MPRVKSALTWGFSSSTAQETGLESKHLHTGQLEAIVSSHKLRVLVVDDERMIADTLVQIFASQGFESRAAYDGFEALAQAVSFAPDVLITDIVMPGIDGWQLAEQYGRLLPACRVMLFSGHADLIDLEERADLMDRACEVYTKPVSPRVFLDRLQIESQLLR